MKNYTALYINILFIVIGVLLLELIFGQWFFDKGIVRLNLVQDQTLSYSVKHLYDGEKDVIHYTRDIHGLRGDYDSVKDIDILTIGGSTTDQRYLDNSDTWQSVLKNHFVEDGNTDISVVNAGVDGQSTTGHLKNFDLWFSQIADLSPKYILFYVGLNDFLVSKTHKHDDLAGEHSVKAMIQAKSAMYYIYRTVKGVVLANLNNANHQKVDFSTVEWVQEGLMSTLQCHDTMDKAAQRYKHNLEQLFQKTRAMGAMPILVTQKSYEYTMRDNQVYGLSDVKDFHGTSYNGVDKACMLSYLNMVALETCQSNNATCVPLAENLSFSQGDFYDYLHNTPEGAEKIGRYLYTQLKQKIK